MEHEFEEEGTFEVSLTIDNGNETDTSIQLVGVVADPDRPWSQFSQNERHTGSTPLRGVDETEVGEIWKIFMEDSGADALDENMEDTGGCRPDRKWHPRHHRVLRIEPTVCPGGNNGRASLGQTVFPRD